MAKGKSAPRSGGRRAARQAQKAKDRAWRRNLFESWKPNGATGRGLDQPSPKKGGQP